MENNNFIMKHFPSKWPKLKLIKNEIRDIFIQCLVFNKAIIPLTIVGYELLTADLVHHTSSTI